MSSPLFVQDSISRAQSASPFPWSPTQDGFTIPSISSVRSVQGSPDRVQFRFKRRFCILTYSQVPPDFLMRGLARAYIATADCAPYHENCTRMAELTTMLSWTINACEIDRQSRWDVAGHHPNITPVSRLHTRLLNTCRKIATSRMTALTNQTDRDATLDVLKEMANASGQRSYLHQTKTAFLNHQGK